MSRTINSVPEKSAVIPQGLQQAQNLRMGPYNGYSGAERMDKYREYKRLKKLRQNVPEVGPCQLCGDPHANVGPHTEDYSLPYKWVPPAEYMVCRSCHWWVHMRFKRPDDWLDFKSHVSRGGYGIEFNSAEVLKERQHAAIARSHARGYAWRTVSGRTRGKADDWWQMLSPAVPSP